MTTSLQEDIIRKLNLLLAEQGLPPPPPPGGDAAAPPPGSEPPAGADEEPAEEDEEEAEGDQMVDSGQPPINENDPVSAVYDYGVALGKKTVDPQVIVNGVKSAIQANFGYNMEAAWPVVERFRNTENQIMIDVANRIALFISGTIQENYKRAIMKVSKQEIRNIVREAVAERNSRKLKKEISISPVQLENVINKVVNNILKEGALFDTYRTQIDQEQSAIEQQLTSADIRRMAIDLFEKICDKTGVDSDSLTPEAMEFVKAELDRMVTSAQEIANKLIQVATVVKTAAGGTKTNSEGEE
jgi:hypothetical protein